MSSTIETLPVEILLSICFYLPGSSSAAFSLTSKPMLSKLGRGYIADLGGEYANKVETRRFLRLLSRDIPDVWACEACLCLHRHRWTQASGTRSLKKCIMDSEESHVIDTCSLKELDAENEQRLFSGHKDVTWTCLNDVMRSFAAGGISNQNLQELGTARSDYPSLPVLEGMEFRISDQGQLLMRDIRSYHNPTTQNIYICPHVYLELQDPRAGSKLPSTLSCAYSHQNTSEQYHCPSCAVLFSCEQCPTEYMILRADEESTEHVRGLQGINLTRWLNLGDMTDPFEPFWRSHLGAQSLSNSLLNRLKESPLYSAFYYVPGSIVAAWEQNWL